MKFGTGVFGKAGHDGVASLGEERVFLALTPLITALVQLDFPKGFVTGGSEVPPNGERFGTPPATAIGLADGGGNCERVSGIDRIHRGHNGWTGFG